MSLILGVACLATRTLLSLITSAVTLEGTEVDMLRVPCRDGLVVAVL